MIWYSNVKQKDISSVITMTVTLNWSHLQKKTILLVAIFLLNIETNRKTVCFSQFSKFFSRTRRRTAYQYIKKKKKGRETPMFGDQTSLTSNNWRHLREGIGNSSSPSKETIAACPL